MSELDAPRPVDPTELGFERIRYEKAGHRATITLNRPEVLNALDRAMHEQLSAALPLKDIVLPPTGGSFGTASKNRRKQAQK